jgi:hypothetical protein
VGDETDGCGWDSDVGVVGIGDGFEADIAASLIRSCSRSKD